jgi:hypothetical protein
LASVARFVSGQLSPTIGPRNARAGVFIDKKAGETAIGADNRAKINSHPKPCESWPQADDMWPRNAWCLINVFA